jgi:hypothetical protein
MPKSELRLKAEDLLKDLSPSQVAKKLFNESGWKDSEQFSRRVRQWKADLSNIRQQTEISVNSLKTTSSSSFHKLKTELGLHDNEFNLPTPVDDSVKSVKLPTGCDNILFIGDLQIPFHDISAITCAIKYGQQHNVNTIYINGDLVDFYSISSYQTEKSKRDLVNEIEMTREFLSILRSVFPNAQIYLKRGNHEIRWERYIFNNAKAFEDLQELQFSAMFHLDKYNIHLIEDTTIVSIGGLTAIHAHEVRGVGGVFPARTLFMKTLTSAICGDCHRTSEYTGKSITDRFHTCWTVGCLSVLRPNYAPGAQYNHGFAHIRTNGEDFSVKNFRILDGKII